MMESLDSEYFEQVPPADDRRTYRLIVQHDPNEADESENEDIFTTLETIEVEQVQNNTTWSPNESLAMINIFSLHKDELMNFKRKKDQWTLISRELSKIGIDKMPDRCEVKWRNMIRTYRHCKRVNKTSKFEFYRELNQIFAEDPRFEYTMVMPKVRQSDSHQSMIKKDLGERQRLTIMPNIQKKLCNCAKNEKRSRHEERMTLMKKKVQIEERKVKAFEDYIKFLKSTHKY